MQVHQILFFDKSGKILRRVGRQGQGPLEFNMPMQIAVTSDTIFVFEANGRRLQLLTLMGEFVRTVTPNPPFVFWSDWIATGDGKIYHPPGGYRADGLIVVYDFNGNKADSFGNLEAESFDVLDMTATKRYAKKREIAPTLKNNLILCRTADRAIVAAHTALPLLKKFTPDGKLMWSKTLALPALDVIREKFSKPTTTRQSG